MGWFGHGRMVEPFEEAAFAGQPGELLGPIETLFGFHVMQVLDKRGEEVRVRHVLVSFGRGRAIECRAKSGGRARGGDQRGRRRRQSAGDRDAGGLGLGGGDRARPLQLPPVYEEGLQGLDPGRATVLETPTGYSVIVSRGAGGGEDVEFEDIAPRLRVSSSSSGPRRPSSTSSRIRSTSTSGWRRRARSRGPDGVTSPPRA